MPDWPNIFAALREDGVRIDEHTDIRGVGGGDISSAWRIGDVFVKTGDRAAFDMLEAEAEGLGELSSANAIRTPEVLACGRIGRDAYLATEWIEFDRPSANTEEILGRQLANLHRYCKDRFGWHRDNTIGLTPQHNPWSDDWVKFVAEHRLGFQLELAARKGFDGELRSAGANLKENITALFRGYTPSASLLHGDLWGGNWAATNGRPVIFDPAVYYGDRESDIAMTQLFGGFGRQFYAAYKESWPMESGHEERMKLYQLYHVLNHLNLFGAGYLGRAIRLIRDLNARLAHQI